MTVHGLFILQLQQLSVLGSVEEQSPQELHVVAREERRFLEPSPEAERVQWLGNLWPKPLRRRGRVRSSKSANSAPIPARSKCSPTCRSSCRARRRSSSSCTAAARPRPATIFGAGWSTLAKRYGFALLMPEQQGVEQRQHLLQLVQSGRCRARPRRSRVDPADDRADGRRSQHRFRAASISPASPPAAR